jgi:serine/threonine protein kinase
MAVYIATRVCEGLDHAHTRRDSDGRGLQIVHRDISPENVMVSYTGDVKIVDFGIAKAETRASKTRSGVLKGKFGYMSPEQVRGLPYDHRVDVFSCGILLWELLVGRRLFTEKSDVNTIENVRNAVVEPPSGRNPLVPEELDKIVLRALAKDPEERYSSAAQMGQELQVFLKSCQDSFSKNDMAAFMVRTFRAEMEKEAGKNRKYEEMIELTHIDTVTDLPER